MTAIVSPTLAIIYKRSTRPIRYKRRSLQGTKANSELRLLICISSLKNVPGIIQLLDFSRTSKQTVCVFALHLVELSRGASAMLIVHNSRKSSSISSVSHHEENPDSDRIFRLLGDYEDENPNVSINPLTAMSPFDTMHEDICSLSEDKRVAFLIVPYHKQVMEDGHMEANSALCSVNQCVLLESPCSVGILVDRSLGVAKEWRMHRVAVVFLGGADDREALTFAWRMVGNSEVRLTVFRFLFGSGHIVVDEPVDLLHKHVPLLLPTRSFMHRQTQIDDEFLYEFRLRTASEESVDYQEKQVHNGEELRTSLKELGQKNELYIVGRGSGLGSPLTAGLDKEFSDSPELGIVGGILASTDPSTSSSVLVVQQYVGPVNGVGNYNDSVSYAKTNAGTMSVRSRDSEFGMWRHNSIGNSTLYDNDVEAFMKHKRKYEHDESDDDDESTY